MLRLSWYQLLLLGIFIAAYSMQAPDGADNHDSAVAAPAAAVPPATTENTVPEERTAVPTAAADEAPPPAKRPRASHPTPPPPGTQAWPTRSAPSSRANMKRFSAMLSGGGGGGGGGGSGGGGGGFRPAFFNSHGRSRNPSRVSLAEMRAAQQGDRGKTGLASFRKAKETGKWHLLHSGHFDWWMFPIDDGSRPGYNVFKDDVAELLADKTYVANYREAVHLALLAWGWDTETSAPVEKPKPGMGWTNWDVRLAKICRSLYIFRQHDLLLSCQAFARTIKPNGGFRYAGINLDELLHFKLDA